jgi:hypothetical protein
VRYASNDHVVKSKENYVLVKAGISQQIVKMVVEWHAGSTRSCTAMAGGGQGGFG